jgi:hypothetical protein
MEGVAWNRTEISPYLQLSTAKIDCHIWERALEKEKSSLFLKVKFYEPLRSFKE